MMVSASNGRPRSRLRFDEADHLRLRSTKVECAIVSHTVVQVTNGANHPLTIDRWDDATGKNLVEQLAGVSDYLLALTIYQAAVRRWPDAKITLRNRARIIERNWKD
jgi:hypothetical protein